jgi:elongation factor Ts
VVYEKPFGTSAAGFRALDRVVHSVLAEDQVYRIDHFLGKEATQDLHVLRFANQAFAALWNREHIDSVQVSVYGPDATTKRQYVQAEIARQSGRPENVIEKMMEGRMRKFYEETVLLQQTFVIDGETQIVKVLEKAAKELGAPITVEGFVRFQVGEGIDKPQDDFGDEVARMAGGR